MDDVRGLDFWRGATWVLVAYDCALLAALLVGRLVGGGDPVLAAWWGDVAATVAVWLFSTRFRNSSFYDAYWSVVPPVIVGYWLVWHGGDGHPLRQALLLGVVAFWATRLTANWLTGWTGLDHEDWRYTRLRQQTGAAFPLVDLLGIHLFPTVLVFLGTLPAWWAVTSDAPFGLLDALAFSTAGLATVLEGLADRQMRAFKARGPAPDACIDEGLWAWSRHPNYVGEILFWVGVWMFGLQAGAPGWTIAGPLCMIALFRVVSIPMMERRTLAKRPAFAEHVARKPMLLPFPPWRMPR